MKGYCEDNNELSGSTMVENFWYAKQLNNSQHAVCYMVVPVHGITLYRGLQSQFHSLNFNIK